MELHALGFDDWFQRKLGEIDKLGYSLACIPAVNRDDYLLRNETSEVLAELTDSLMFSTESSIDLPAVGDWAFAPLLSNIFTPSLQM